MEPPPPRALALAEHGGGFLGSGGLAVPRFLPARGAWRALMCCACARHVRGFGLVGITVRALSVARYGDIEGGDAGRATHSLGTGGQAPPPSLYPP